MARFCGLSIFLQTGVNKCCDHVVLSASCHLYWIPPGLVLSSLLYIMYTDDCRSNQENSYLVKFADDSALLYLLL